MEFINGNKMEKKFIIFGGVNGVGKSTYRNLSGVSNFIIDPDDLTRDSFGSYKEALIKEKELEYFFSTTGLSFGRETTLTGKTIFKKIERMKKLKYGISLIFIDVDDVNICIQRVKKRVNEGGHDIPTESIVRRYNTIISNLKTQIKNGLFDDILFIDNSLGNNRVIGIYANNSFKQIGITKEDINNINSVYNRIKIIFED